MSPRLELYFSPFACSLAAHMLCREAGLDVKLRRVNLRTKELENGDDFRTISPKGMVPVLGLGEGRLLTESLSVLTYLADLRPDLKLAPGDGSPERYDMLAWLSYIGSELHKRIFYMIFWCDDHHAATARAAAPERLKFLSDHLEDRPYLINQHFTAADAYLCWWLSLTKRAGIDLAPFPVLRDYAKRHYARPGVGAAMAHEKALLSA